jgi:hypothetical protein
MYEFYQSAPSPTFWPISALTFDPLGLLKISPIESQLPYRGPKRADLQIFAAVVWHNG